MNTYTTELTNLVTNINTELESFYSKQNKAAAKRARGYLREMKNLCKTISADVQAAKKAIPKATKCAPCNECTQVAAPTQVTPEVVAPTAPLI